MLTLYAPHTNEVIFLKPLEGDFIQYVRVDAALVGDIRNPQLPQSVVDSDWKTPPEGEKAVFYGVVKTTADDLTLPNNNQPLAILFHSDEHDYIVVKEGRASKAYDVATGRRLKAVGSAVMNEYNGHLRNVTQQNAYQDFSEAFDAAAKGLAFPPNIALKRWLMAQLPTPIPDANTLAIKKALTDLCRAVVQYVETNSEVAASEVAAIDTALLAITRQPNMFSTMEPVLRGKLESSIATEHYRTLAVSYLNNPVLRDYIHQRGCQIILDQHRGIDEVAVLNRFFDPKKQPDEIGTYEAFCGLMKNQVPPRFNTAQITEAEFNNIKVEHQRLHELECVEHNILRRFLIDNGYQLNVGADGKPHPDILSALDYLNSIAKPGVDPNLFSDPASFEHVANALNNILNNPRPLIIPQDFNQLRSPLKTWADMIAGRTKELAFIHRLFPANTANKAMEAVRGYLLSDDHLSINPDGARVNALFDEIRSELGKGATHFEALDGRIQQIFSGFNWADVPHVETLFPDSNPSRDARRAYHLRDDDNTSLLLRAPQGHLTALFFKNDVRRVDENFNVDGLSDRAYWDNNKDGWVRIFWDDNLKLLGQVDRFGNVEAFDFTNEGRWNPSDRANELTLPPKNFVWPIHIDQQLQHEQASAYKQGYLEDPSSLTNSIDSYGKSFNRLAQDLALVSVPLRQLSGHLTRFNPAQQLARLDRDRLANDRDLCVRSADQLKVLLDNLVKHRDILHAALNALYSRKVDADGLPVYNADRTAQLYAIELTDVERNQLRQKYEEQLRNCEALTNDFNDSYWCAKNMKARIDDALKNKPEMVHLQEHEDVAAHVTVTFGQVQDDFGVYEAFEKDKEYVFERKGSESKVAMKNNQIRFDEKADDKVLAYGMNKGNQNINRTPIIIRCNTADPNQVKQAKALVAMAVAYCERNGLNPATTVIAPSACGKISGKQVTRAEKLLDDNPAMSPTGSAIHTAAARVGARDGLQRGMNALQPTVDAVVRQNQVEAGGAQPPRL